MAFAHGREQRIVGGDRRPAARDAAGGDALVEIVPDRGGELGLGGDEIRDGGIGRQPFRGTPVDLGRNAGRHRLGREMAQEGVEGFDGLGENGGRKEE